jgi:hypothetical protein
MLRVRCSRTARSIGVVNRNLEDSAGKAYEYLVFGPSQDWLASGCAGVGRWRAGSPENHRPACRRAMVRRAGVQVLRDESHRRVRRAELLGKNSLTVSIHLQFATRQEEISWGSPQPPKLTPGRRSGADCDPANIRLRSGNDHCAQALAALTSICYCWPIQPSSDGERLDSLTIR